MAADLRRPSGRPLLIGALLMLATVFFVWGAAAEHSGHTETVHSATATSEGSGNAETSGAHAGETNANASAEPQGEGEYRPLGINLESTSLVIAVAVISVGLAGLVAWRPSKGSLLAVVILASAFTVVEVVEVVHQADVSNTGLLLVAFAACVTHAAVALLAGNEVRVVGRSAGVALAT